METKVLVNTEMKQFYSLIGMFFFTIKTLMQIQSTHQIIGGPYNAKHNTHTHTHKKSS